MKKIITFLLVLSLPNLLMASTTTDVRNAKRDLAAIEKQIKKLEYQKSNLTIKFEEAQQELQEAQEKVEALQDKTKSLQYKNALKKTEILPAKIQEYSLSVQMMESQIDSLNNLLVVAEESLQVAETAKSEERTVKKLARQKTSIESTPVEEPSPTENQSTDLDYTYTNSGTSLPSSNEDSSTISPWWWLIACVVSIFVLLKLLSGGRSAHSGGTGRSSTGDRWKRDHKTWISSEKRDLANLRAKMASTSDSRMRRSLKIQIEQLKARIASHKAQL